jgi:hemerythrin
MSQEEYQTRIALLEQNHKTIMDLFKSYAEENSKQHQEVKELIKEMATKLDKDFATKNDINLVRADFMPVKIVVYTITSVAGIGAITALLQLILK